MKTILLLAIFGLMISSCNNSKSLPGKIENDNSGYLSTSWQLQSLFASDNNWLKAPLININLKDKTFTGNSDCNSISGKFTISENYISIDKNIITTKMFCAGNYEKAFLSALIKINKFTINKDELELGQGDIVLMKFKKTSQN